jgi:hypothetical protein
MPILEVSMLYLVTIWERGLSKNRSEWKMRVKILLIKTTKPDYILAIKHKNFIHLSDGGVPLEYCLLGYDAVKSDGYLDAPPKRHKHLPHYTVSNSKIH